MTTGKVFRESTDIYQDQARILFDYYKAAAQKIVAEEIAIENEKASLQNSKDENSRKMAQSRTLMIVSLAAVAASAIGAFFLSFLFVLAIAGVIAGIKFFLDRKKCMDIDTQIEKQIADADERYSNIRRDYAVEKMGVAYIPVAVKVPFEGKSLLIDQTGKTADTEFRLNVIHQPEELSKVVQDLQESMSSFPVVEDTEASEEINTSDYSLSVQNVMLHDYVGNIDRQVRNVNYLLGDSETVTVELPLIKPESQEANAVEQYATNNPASGRVVQVFDDNYGEKLTKLAELNANKDQFGSKDDIGSNPMTKLMGQLAESVQLLTKEKNAGSGKLVTYTSAIFANVLKAGYNHYSPELEAEEIDRIRTTEFNYHESVNEYTPFSLNKSSEVKLDIFSNNWVAEDGSRTSMPFGMQQVEEEVLAPVITALLEENRIERLRIYNNIEDQKREYLEKWSSEVGEYYRDNRNVADELITHMRETYADYMSAYNMYKSLQNTTESLNRDSDISASEVIAIDSEAEMLAGFEQQSKQFSEQQDQFADYMDRIQDDINDITKDFAHIDYYEGLLRDNVSHQTAVAMHEVHKLDERRKQLVRISPYLAANAELQPTPKNTPELMEAVDIDLERQVKERLQAIDNIRNKNTETIQ